MGGRQQFFRREEATYCEEKTGRAISVRSKLGTHPQQVQHQHTRQELIPQLDGEGGGLEEQGGNEETEGGQADHPGEVRSLDYSWGQEREDHGEN